MIVPFFQHLLHPSRYPITLILIFLNVGLFALVSPNYFTSQSSIEDLIGDDQFLDAQAKIFAQMIVNRPSSFAGPLAVLAEEVSRGEPDSMQVLGRLALRSPEFMARAPAFAFKGDRVLYRNWQSEFARFAVLRSMHPNYSLGFSSMTPGLEHYVTYQFLHGGFGHLIVNMVALALVGSVLEPILGCAWFLVLYLVCGVGAVVGFQLLSGATPIPLVGASGSIMGLFGVLMAARWREPLRFVWLLPTSSYAGYVYLPVWIFVIYLILSDVAGYIETESWMGIGVAHAAHLGGFVTGMILGTVLRRAIPVVRGSDSAYATPELKGWNLSKNRR